MARSAPRATAMSSSWNMRAASNTARGCGARSASSSFSARSGTTAAWYAACAPLGRNAWSRPWLAGSGKDRGLRATSGARMRRLCHPIPRANSTAGTTAGPRGRHLKTLGASRRHRLRIKAKRLRYMLEALTETVALRGRDELHHRHRPAKRLQRALGDMRDLKRFAELASGSPQVENGKRGKKHPPGYRHRKEKLLGDAHRRLITTSKYAGGVR